METATSNSKRKSLATQPAKKARLSFGWKSEEAIGFWTACQSGNVEKCRAILASVLPHTGAWWRPLHDGLKVAIYNDFPNIVTEIADQVVPKLRAQAHGFGILRLFRDHRNVPHNDGRSSLSRFHYNHLCEWLTHASRKGSLEVMTQLIEAKADVMSQQKHHDALLAAVSSGQTAAIKKLIDAKCDATAICERMRSAIFCAVTWNDVPALELLANAKADLTCSYEQPPYGGCNQTPLQFALAFNKSAAASFLQAHAQTLQQQRPRFLKLVS